VLGHTQDVSVRFSRHYIECFLTLSLKPGPLQEAAKQGMPLLLIHGKADLQVNPQQVLDIAVRPFFPNAGVHHLDGVGHTPFYEAEKEVAGFILGFVSRISPARHDDAL